MSYSKDALRGRLRIRDIISIFKFNKQFRNLHPDFFHPDGILLFTGPQGSGKTLSAVKYVRNLKKMYPKCNLISNIRLRDIESMPFIGFRESIEEYPSNGEYGTIMLIDEIQTEFSSLESKNVSPSEIAIISQQRKRRVHIVGTSQLFTRIAKPFREQCMGALDCDAFIFDTIQRNRLIDFSRCAYDINGNLTELAYSGQFFWTRSPDDYAAYDTTQIISKTKGDKQK